MTEELNPLENASKLYKKIIEVRKGIEVVKEKAGGYKAFTADSLNNALTPLLNKVGVIQFPETADFKLHPIEINGKQKYLASGIGKVKLCDAETGYTETFFVPFGGLNAEGDAAKSIGTAQTYALKYFWIGALNLTEREADPDDVEFPSPATPVVKGVDNSGVEALLADAKGETQVESDFDMFVGSLTTASTVQELKDISIAGKQLALTGDEKAAARAVYTEKLKELKG